MEWVHGAPEVIVRFTSTALLQEALDSIGGGVRGVFMVGTGSSAASEAGDCSVVKMLASLLQPHVALLVPGAVTGRRCLLLAGAMIPCWDCRLSCPSCCRAAVPCPQVF